MGALDSQLHAIRVLTLQILFLFFFPPRHDVLAKACFQLETSSLGQRKRGRESSTQGCSSLLGLIKEEKKNHICKLRAFCPALTEVFQ